MMRKSMTIAVALLSGMLSIPVMAQEAPQGGNNPPARDGGGNEGGGRRQRGNMEEWRQRQNDRLKTALGMNDEEFTAIQPKVDALRRAQRDATMPMFGFGGGGRGGRGDGGGDRNRGGDNNQPQQQQQQQPQQSEVQTKARALQDAIEQKASDGEVVAKLEEYRAARTKAKDEFKKAQDDLRQFITKRQEAVFVSNGLLE